MSILRRTLVIKFKALFYDKAYIAANAVDPEKNGIFVRDPTLKDFLKEGPACVATLRIIWQFAEQYSAEQCRQALEDYVMNGADGGLTEASVRMACNLPVEAPGSENGLEAQQSSAATVDPKQALKLQQKREHAGQLREIMEFMLEERKDWLTASQLRTAKRRFQNFNKSHADAVLQALVDGGCMTKHDQALRKVGKVATFSPIVVSRVRYVDIVDTTQDTNLVCCECYDFSRVQRATCNTSPRVINKATIQRHVAEAGKEFRLQTRRGRLSNDAQQRQEKQKLLRDELEASMRNEQALYEELAQQIAEGQPGNDAQVSVQRTYHYTIDNHRTRRVVSQPGAQNLSCAFRKLACPDVRDFDICACMFCLVVQLVERLDVESELEAASSHAGGEWPLVEMTYLRMCSTWARRRASNYSLRLRAELQYLKPPPLQTKAPADS